MFNIFRIYGKEMNVVSQEIDLLSNQIVLTGKNLMFLKLVNIGLLDTLVHLVSFMKHSIEIILTWFLFVQNTCTIKIFLNIKNL